MNTFADSLAHFGIKGMKWGVRRSRAQLADSEDHTRAKTLRKKSRFGKTKKLTNDELKTIIERMNLEQQYSNLRKQTGGGEAGKIAKELLLGVGKEHAKKALADNAGKLISGLIKK